MNAITETPVVRTVMNTVAETAAKTAAVPMIERVISAATGSLPRLTDHLADMVVERLGGSRTNRGYLGGSTFLAGLVVGGGAALLLTPMTGKQLREAIVARVGGMLPKKDLAEKIDQKVDEGKHVAKDLVKDGKHFAKDTHDTLESARDTVSPGGESAAKKVESAATKATDKVEAATHEEVAEARRLFRNVVGVTPPAKA